MFYLFIVLLGQIVEWVGNVPPKIQLSYFVPLLKEKYGQYDTALVNVLGPPIEFFTEVCFNDS